MDIVAATPTDKKVWNNFVREHYPPIGSFMHTWEWGTFQEKLGRPTSRYLIKEQGRLVGLFTLINQSLPARQCYGYIPRGPIFASFLSTKQKTDLLEKVGTWAREKFPQFIFLRFEPPWAPEENYSLSSFIQPAYYVQPRHNLAIHLEPTEEEIIQTFHPSTRSNLKRATRRGAHTERKKTITQQEYDYFFAMIDDTIERNSGHNAYPGHQYFQTLFSAVPPLAEQPDPESLRLAFFCGYQNDALASLHAVLFFGRTATYLYGASYTKHLSSKITTHLHWEAAREAKRLGCHYYDLGGIDETRWPTLTDFKKQFRGKIFHYIGNLDLPFHPQKYRLYNLLRRISKR